LTEIGNAAKICFHFGQVMGEVTITTGGAS